MTNPEKDRFWCDKEALAIKHYVTVREIIGISKRGAARAAANPAPETGQDRKDQRIKKNKLG